MLNVFLGILLTLTCMFLIILVLLQRGRGGGLTGALGGTSQSAFGAKAGDTFTWVTVGATGFWILLCMTIILTVNKRKDISEGRDDKATIGGDNDTLSNGTSGPDSDTTDSDTTDSDTTDSDTTDSDTTDSDTDPKTPDAEDTDPKTPDAEDTDPKPADPETTEADSGKPTTEPSNDASDTPGTDAPGSDEPSGSPEPKGDTPS